MVYSINTHARIDRYGTAASLDGFSAATAGLAMGAASGGGGAGSVSAAAGTLAQLLDRTRQLQAGAGASKRGAHP
eukprot:COSAG05_NODE_615_length_8327_cov_6.112543_2_plen_75_part_00